MITYSALLKAEKAASLSNIPNKIIEQGVECSNFPVTEWEHSCCDCHPEHARLHIH